MHETCRKEGVLMPVNVNEIEPDEKIVEIEMERLREFRNHPFKVKADGQMLQLIRNIVRQPLVSDFSVAGGFYFVIWLFRLTVQDFWFSARRCRVQFPLKWWRKYYEENAFSSD